MEEGKRQRIHVSSGLFSGGVKRPFLPARFGSSSFPIGAAPPRLEEQRRAETHGRRMDVGGEERGCRAFLLLLLLLEARALTGGQDASGWTRYFRWNCSK